MRNFDRISLKDNGEYEVTIESQVDEESTVELAMSSIDGSCQELGSLKSHPHDRRHESERIARYTLIAFFVALTQFYFASEKFHPT
jgi:hypothetical protein